MKIVTPEERQAQEQAALVGGAKGAAIGTVISLGLYGLCKNRYPSVLKLGTSAKTAIFITPPAFTASLMGELASNNFDHDMYSSEQSQRDTLEESRRWQEMPMKDKIIQGMNNNKYKIITGMWALSMWGSWEYVNRDKLLTQKQKFYEARMYAQFITIALLLGSISLSMADEEDEKKQKKLTAEDRAFNEVLTNNKTVAASAVAASAAATDAVAKPSIAAQAVAALPK